MNEMVPFTDGFRRFDTILQEMRDFQNSIFSDPFFVTPKLFKSSSALPKINVKETEAEYLVEAALAGFKKEDIELSVEDKHLCIASKSSNENVVKNENEGYVFKELSSKSFRRVIPFPKNIDEEKITATLENGFLTVKVPKASTHDKLKRISII